MVTTESPHIQNIRLCKKYMKSEVGLQLCEVEFMCHIIFVVFQGVLWVVKISQLRRTIANWSLKSTNTGH